MTLDPQSLARQVQTTDGRLNVVDYGEGHPMVLLHGGGPGATGWSNYAPNIGSLGDRFRVIAPDMPGFGGSDPADFGTVDHVHAAVQLLDALDIERAAFVGNSMGGHTAIRLAYEHPDRVSHLITMGPPLQMGPILFGAGGGPTEGVRIMMETYADPSPEGMRRLVEIMVFDRATFARPELVEERSQAALAHPEHLANVLAAAPGAPIPIWADKSRLSSISAPTLLIHGRDDRVVSFETTLLLAAAIPDSRAVLINRCGHWAQLEHAEEFNRLVTDFVLHH